MKIDGKGMADGVLADLITQTASLKEKGITPTLAVILVGDNTESLAYIRQKQKATERIGGRFIFEHLPQTSTQKELTARVLMYNRDRDTCGLIVQRPIINHLKAHVDTQKDIDGLEPGTQFDVPVAMAIFKILQDVDLKNKKIVIIGRGETAGKPIAEAFAKKQCTTSIITSQTPNPKEIMKQADILISCVGKQGIVTADSVKHGAVLISVGLSRGIDGTLHGDYEEDEVKNTASFYTPTPGGVGPLNIACLMQNLVLAAQKMTH